MNIKMEIDVRVALYNGNLGELIKRYSPDFIPFPEGRVDVEKYALPVREGSTSYMMMVSKDAAPHVDYNVMLTVIGDRISRCREISHEFETKTRLITRAAPVQLIELYRRILAASNHNALMNRS